MCGKEEEKSELTECVLKRVDVFELNMLYLSAKDVQQLIKIDIHVDSFCNKTLNSSLLIIEGAQMLACAILQAHLKLTFSLLSISSRIKCIGLCKKNIYLLDLRWEFSIDTNCLNSC